MHLYVSWMWFESVYFLCESAIICIKVLGLWVEIEKKKKKKKNKKTKQKRVQNLELESGVMRYKLIQVCKGSKVCVIKVGRVFVS